MLPLLDLASCLVPPVELEGSLLQKPHGLFAQGCYIRGLPGKLHLDLLPLHRSQLDVSGSSKHPSNDRIGTPAYGWNVTKMGRRSVTLFLVWDQVSLAQPKLTFSMQERLVIYPNKLGQNDCLVDKPPWPPSCHCNRSYLAYPPIWCRDAE